MNKLFLRGLFLLALLFSTAVSFAQDTNQVEMADTMRANGKIYVVVAVCLVILIGLFLYMIRVDKKVSRLEKESRQQG
ncbi:MAG: CcmD family protein [Sphingobacteriales bacterium]|nr:MAG: CcmD family protein [Sphingobacteriales bacterium]